MGVLPSSPEEEVVSVTKLIHQQLEKLQELNHFCTPFLKWSQSEEGHEELAEIQLWADRSIGPIKIVPNVPVKGYELIELDSNSGEYQLIDQTSYFNHRVNCVWQAREIVSIQKINNPTLKVLYDLKKNEVLSVYGSYSETNLFHGTKNCNLDSICRNNLNRRQCCGHKFGHGVSFSPQPFYSSHYCDYGSAKVMLVCKVLTGRSSTGYSSTRLPESGCDYTQNDTGSVVVKYHDDTYLPTHVIKYV